ncbi:tyrosine-type recombinase/integrase [Kribbella sp. NPDC049227]|uniref:tyrosine-type recombinase/integrase n=1 Tax=Kribbella sp. NPDC049227 TaxID=3364113 RepID=UPI003722F486
MTNPRMELSYDVRLHKTEVVVGKRTTSYKVRWSVAKRPFKLAHRTSKLAESFRSKLVTAAREGLPFDTKSGLPAPMAKALYSRSWFDHACQYVDTKWPRISPGHRRGISETLTLATLALLGRGNGRPSEAEIRKALHTWAFSKAARGGLPYDQAIPPQEYEAAIVWLKRNTLDLSELEQSEILRETLDRLATRQDGKAAAAKTVTRRRATLHAAVQYAVQLGQLPANPLDTVQWESPRSTDRVDPRLLPNRRTVKRLLAEIREFCPWLEAYYACLYYAMMRPAEARHLNLDNLIDLPEEGWGELLLDGSTQQAGERWTDDGSVRQERSLKHRPDNTTRRVPADPNLVRVLRRHVELFGAGPDGHLFVTRTGRFGRPVPAAYCKPVHPNTVTRVWAKARQRVLTADQIARKLAARPYDLRHAGITFQLNGGVTATQVSEWAGNSAKVVMEVYAGCIDGQAQTALRVLMAATTLEEAAG